MKYYLSFFIFLTSSYYPLISSEARYQNTPEDQTQSLSSAKKQIWNYVRSKIIALSCSSFICGKNCTQAVQSLPEYTLAKMCCTYCSNPYYLAAAATTGACILCCNELYRTKTCCFDREWSICILQPNTPCYNH